MSRDYGKPCVVAGFEPLDILQSVLMLMRQLDEGRCEVENQYGRVVLWEGNLQALKSMAEVFELRPYFEWRGVGVGSPTPPHRTPAGAGTDGADPALPPGGRGGGPAARRSGAGGDGG